MYDEDDFLQLSGIQHFAFCRRQWALIHIENAWADNLRTTEGALMHERAHNPMLAEKRGGLIVAREMRVFSRKLGVSGQCDVTEFTPDDERGVELTGRPGKWFPRPVEYKRGSPKVSDADRLQLTAQAMCLEEMLCCGEIETGYLYYGETRRREPVGLTAELRGAVRDMFAQMHELTERGSSLRVKPTKSCGACSLRDLCLPKLPEQSRSVRAYLDSELRGDA
ncbi:MAG: CRISPR-associated protein Cas4 [Oscillospiraceae bacterium]|jgi:CRISPR-associated exonuclease Cas4|nr:CRISPR-associated protein Cas4 [Oscillospiraceae bacterium]